MTARLVVAALEPAACVHLARALEAHERWCHANGYRSHPQLAQLALAIRSPTGQDGPKLASGLQPPEDARAMPLTYTPAQVAELLNVSESTVKRMFGTGELAHVEVAGKRRVRREDLESYVGALTAGPSARVEVAAEMPHGVETAVAQGGIEGRATKAEVLAAHLEAEAEPLGPFAKRAPQ